MVSVDAPWPLDNISRDWLVSHRVVEPKEGETVKFFLSADVIVTLDPADIRNSKFELFTVTESKIPPVTVYWELSEGSTRVKLFATLTSFAAKAKTGVAKSSRAVITLFLNIKLICVKEVNN